MHGAWRAHEREAADGVGVSRVGAEPAVACSGGGGLFGVAVLVGFGVAVDVGLAQGGGDDVAVGGQSEDGLVGVVDG